jgi:hypothetical protein
MDAKSALTELANDIKREILRRMSSDVGINPRTGTNTLVNSSLYHSVDVYPRSENTIIFQIADYYEFVVRGWAHTGRYAGTRQQFLYNLLQWVRRKHISWGNLTENQIVYLVYRRINEDLIAPRPFINYDPNEDVNKILPFLDEYFDKWAENIFNKITEELDKYFND